MPVFDDATLNRLLGSIEAGNLILLCGAGLSIPTPSNLWPAVRVARHCYDKWSATEILPAHLRDDIDQLAGAFYSKELFDTTFIGSLVPWDDLVGEPNRGHAAVADLIISRAAHAVLTANFDPLVEHWAMARKVALQGALTGAEAVQFTATSNPLLKFHGCLIRDRQHTLWTQGQVTEPTVASRIQNCSAWMEVNLPNKDLLVIGFWTDWGYLNNVLAGVITTAGVHSVTVIDPSTSAELQAKAPGLWDRFAGSGATFTHIQASGTDALDELRSGFSTVWARKFFALGKDAIVADGKAYSPGSVDPTALATDELYDLRRDSEGTPYNRAARARSPAHESAAAAFAHLLLANAGAVRRGAWYEFGGKKIRIVHGAGRPIGSVRETYNEPPTIELPDIVICAGSQDISVPGALIASGLGSSIVRAAPGGSSRWLTLEQARTELGI